MTSLRILALASAFGFLTAGPASAFTAWPEIPSTETGIRYEADGRWTADAKGLSTGRSVAHDVQHHPMHHYQMLHQKTQHHRIHANGSCNGISHGTGDRSCGTATGGPVGGNPNRN